MRKKLLAVFVFTGCFFMATVRSWAQDGGDYVVHTVQHGEVPSVLAKKYNVPLVDLISLNKWTSGVVLHVGDKVKLPFGAHLTQPADTVKSAPAAANVVTPGAAVDKPSEEPEGKSAAAAPIINPVHPAAPANHFIIHTVAHGEVPSVLAKKYNVSVDSLASLNNWGAHVILHVGDKVKLPASAHLTDSTKVATIAVAQPVVKTHAEAPQAKSAYATLAPAPAIKTPANTPGFTFHVVQHGEVPSVLAKKYNVTLEGLFGLNNWGPHIILHVGDKIKLPAGAHLANGTDSVKVSSAPVTTIPPPAVVSKPAADTVANTMPVAPTGNQTTYVVQKKETLYSISKKFNITVARLKNWNHLIEDNITEGQKLIIYTNTPPSPTAAGVNNAPVSPSVAVSLAPAQPGSVAPPPLAAAPAQPKPVDTATVPAAGYFSTTFGTDVSGKKLQTANGMAMTFKTASGWTDKKYYILMNDASPGSIVQITNADGKAIYAKVLWKMGNPEDNEGLNFRISDAAAAVLGLNDIKFPITVAYYQ